MNKIKAILAISILVLSILLTSCFYGPAYGPAPHQSRPYYYPYGYYYYPGVRVYFHYTTGFYYYRSGTRWVRSRVLPPHIHLHPKDRVHLNIKKDKPYVKHPQHVERYRPPRNIKRTPDEDRREREVHRKWYQEQQEYKKNKKFNDKAREKDKRR